MKKTTALILTLLLIGTLSACGNSSGESPAAGTDAPAETETSTTASDTEESSSEISDIESGDAEQADGKALVAYFAYSENMGDTSGMEVDAITSASINSHTDNTEGNLQVMARVIEEETGADVFHILMEEPYNPDYETMLPVAIEQMENEEWPALQEKIDNLSEYDVIYIGTPVWNGALPPAMQTFFAENDLSEKTIVPFGIHLGSRFGRMIGEMEELAPGATVVEGFTISASTANDEVESEFRTWLAEQNFVSE